MTGCAGNVPHAGLFATGKRCTWLINIYPHLSKYAHIPEGQEFESLGARDISTQADSALEFHPGVASARGRSLEFSARQASATTDTRIQVHETPLGRHGFRAPDRLKLQQDRFDE